MIKPKLAYFINTVATLCAAIIFTLGLMTVSPKAHHLVHTDCNQNGHSCAVTLFAQGTHSYVPVNFTVVSFFSFSSVTLKPETPVIKTSTDRLKPERGPPIIG
ncbi:MAG: hypothetical protein DVB35_07340 [Verrucomicrobia bacterium]|nr:MAG: hypothetical protein DVB35_07340 [Verrucomicrobiota bacterium]